jgi:hypothetical protein
MPKVVSAALTTKRIAVVTRTLVSFVAAPTMPTMPVGTKPKMPRPSERPPGQRRGSVRSTCSWSSRSWT